MKMDSATLERLAHGDPDLAKILGKNLTVGDVHVASAGGIGGADGAGLTFEQIQARAKDQKPKKVDPVTGTVKSGDDLRNALLDKIAKQEVRSLKPSKDGGAYSPFPHDPNALGQLTPAQTKRFLDMATGETPGAVDREVPIKSLIALHPTVDTEKLADIQNARDEGGTANEGASKAPTVMHHNRKNYLVDGHHRAALDYLHGKNNIIVHYSDITNEPTEKAVEAVQPPGVSIVINQGTPAAPAAKAAPEVLNVRLDGSLPPNWERGGKIVKADRALKMVWGWGNIITEGGKPVVDLQKDVVQPDEMVQFTTKFMIDERVGKADHKGDPVHMVIHSFPMTYELAKAFGIDTENEGWMVGVHVFDESTLARVEAGELQAFSIGGTGDRTEISGS